MFIDVSQFHCQPDFIEHELIHLTALEMATADLPDGANSSSGGLKLIGLGHTGRYVWSQPTQPTAELNLSARTLTDSALEELGNYNATAQTGGTHGLAEHTGKTASKS